MVRISSFHRKHLILVLVVAALLLCSVALVNGGPIYYPDTAAYLIDGDKLSHFRAPYAVRPVFYGVAIFPLHWGTVFFPIVFVQALIVAHIIYLTMRCCGCELQPTSLLGFIGALALLTPVSFHISRVLPDIFVGVLILTLFLLTFCLRSLTRGEVLYLVALSTAATAFHLTAIPIGLALFSLSLLVRFVFGNRLVSPWLVSTPTILAIAISIAFSIMIFQRPTLTPKNPPHLLARILADGPGRDYLSETCPASRFILCDYKDRLTSVEDEFLWRMLPAIPPADAYRIKSEQGAMIRATVSRFPVQVAEHMLGNTLRQLATFQSETQVSVSEWDEFMASSTPLARALSHSRQSQRWFDQPALDAVNAIHAGVALVSLVAVIIVTGLAFRASLFRFTALSATVAIGVLTNAFACGALGGVFSRYEGRVIWLLPLTATAGALVLVRTQSSLRNRGLRLFQPPNQADRPTPLPE